MDDLTGYFTVEKDILYIRGQRDGMEKEREAIVRNLLLHTDFTIAKIAELGNVSEAFVKKVKKGL